MLVVYKPSLLSKTKFLRRVEAIVDSHVFTNDGPYVRKLEEAVAAYVGAECVAVSNATAALYLVAKALNLRELHVPSLTFIATTHALQAAGATLHFLDVMKDMPHIDLRPVRHLPVCAANLYGSGCDVGPGRDDRILVFDSAHALGVSREVPLGSAGTCEIFSMHATKFISAGEGGLITTKDQDLAGVLKDMRNFGFDHRSTRPHGEIAGWGINAKMPEINAALGLTNFEDMEAFREINEENYRTYAEYLPESVTLFDPDRGGFHSNYSYVVVTVPRDIRDDLLRTLYANGIYARKYFHPHAARVYGLTISLPHADRWSDGVICLPTGPTIRKDDIRRICRVLELAGRHGHREPELTASYN
jgi:dTDP-4-amino-4,6-dideoxyglucose